MSKLIKGMDTPKEPWGCPCHDGETGYCRATNIGCYDYINKDCPLVEVPTPHGRLIDADALKQTINDNEYLLSDRINSLDYGMFTVGIMQTIDEQPTADVRENKRGKWVRSDIYNMPYQCSVCGKSQFLSSDFCSHCGADMRSTSTASDTKGGWDGEYYLEDC